MTFRLLCTAALAVAASSAIAAPTFLPTDWTSPGPVAGWEVATNPPPGTDATSFDPFQELLTSLDNGSASWTQAVACSASPNPQPAGRSNWIANAASCSNGAGFGIGGTNWTQFIFRQQFSLTAAEASTLQLSFQWAADDSGEIGATRGSWRPTWSLNSVNPTTFQSTPWPSGINGIPTSYELSPTVTVSGFQPGVNTMYFWVQGNGRTDGMRLANAQVTSVPEPGTLMLTGLGLLALGLARRRSAAGR